MVWTDLLDYGRSQLQTRSDKLHVEGGEKAAAAGNDLWHSNCTVLHGYGGCVGEIKLWNYSCQPAGQSDGTVLIGAGVGGCALCTICGMFNLAKLHEALCCNHIVAT